MPQVTKPVQMVKIEYVCDECGEGTMVRDWDAPALMSHPPLFMHECTHCNHRQTLTTIYPTQGYKEYGL